MIRRVPRPLALLLVVAAVEVLAWTVFAAPLQGPDEIAHFDYTQHLAENWEPPRRDFPEGTNGPDSVEAGSAIGWFNLRTSVGITDARPLWTAVDERVWRVFEETQLPPGSRKNGKGPNAVAQNPPLYYGLQGNLPYRLAREAPILDRLFLMRLVNGGLLLGAVLFVWLLAGELFGRVRWLQTLAAGSVALLAPLAYMGTVINPDTMLVTVFSAFAWIAARMLKRGPTLGSAAVLMGLVAASLLTHGRGFALVVPGVAALGLALWRHRVPWRRSAAAVGLAIVIVGGAVAAGLAVTTGSGGGSAYGGEATISGGSNFSLKGFASYVWQFYFPKLWFMQPSISPDYGFRQVYVDSFFATFASLEVRFSKTVYDVLHTAALAGLIGLVAALAARREWLRRWDLAVVFALMFATLVGLLHFVAYRDLLKVPGDPILVGRYLLPLVPLYAIAIAYVARALPRRAGLALAAAVFTGGALLQLSGIGITAARFYG